MKKAGLIQIGLSGFGKSVAHAVKKCKNAELLGVYDINSDVTNNFARDINVKAYHTLDEVLSSECDGVILEVPNDVHLELTRAAAEAKKHVCVEKPIASSIEEAQEIINVCKQNNIILQVGHSGRFILRYRKLKQLLDENTIGRIVLIEANSSSEKAKRIGTNTWRSFRETCPGGPMLQLGIHEIDNIFYLTGKKPLEIKGVFSNQFTESEADDAGMIIMKLEGEIMAYIGSSYVSPYTICMQVYGDNGKIIVKDSSLCIIKDGEETLIDVTEDYEMNNFVRQYESFADAIITGKRPEVDGEAGLLNLEVILKALS